MTPDPLEPLDSVDRRAVGSVLHRRSKLREAIGSALSAIGGAIFAAATIPGDGNLGHISIVCLFAFLGWLFWVRRGKSLLVTISICITLLVIWWPIALALRELGRSR
jgi:hypothetical protein